MKKVLIANRGEIALRIQRACAGLGIKTLSIASEVDKTALFARQAEELVVIGPAAASESYLQGEKIIKVALERGCDAVHPGYGFLSENAEFAKKVIESGLIFIGPDPSSIEIMGDKLKAKERVKQSGVPIVPGSLHGLSHEELVKEAIKLSFPVIIKAVAGGGGRGMRVVRDEKEMRAALPQASAEALKSFSNAEVYIEKFIEKPRHVEVQVFGDHFGKIVHFGTRDCSLQRRHQKLLEEAPAPFLKPRVREKLETAAVKAAMSVNYKNAGTIEFLVEKEEIYFLEMNTRIQVEHPVTEAITGVDLVQLQLKIARGEKIPLKQEEITFKGHAIEYRLFAEDPENSFFPSLGAIEKMKRPETPGVREDSGYEAGDQVTPHYDAMLSKVIVSGKNRAEAIERSYECLRHYELEGVKTSIPFFKWLLLHSDFRVSPVDIGFVEREFKKENLEQVAISEAPDELYKNPVCGAEVKDLYHYHCKRYDVEYTVQVVHRRDGFFAAIPVSTDGAAAKNINCRMSNGLSTAMDTLIEEVLEVVPPDELF